MTPSHESANGPFYGIFNDSFPPILDGVTLTVENYVHWLMLMGKPPCVVTPWNPEKGDYPFKILRYFSLPIRSRHPYRYGYPKLDLQIWRRLRKTPFLIAHSHCPFSSGRLAVYVKKHQGVPLIGTFHSKYESDLRHSFKHAPWFVTIIMRRILNFFNACDEVWIPQAAVEETVRQYGYKGKLTVVDNGIDFAGLSDQEVTKNRIEARRHLGIDNSDLHLLFIGQHIWEKGTGIILDALALIKDKVRFTMNFVGTGYALEALKEKARINGVADRVRFNGVVSDRSVLRDFYASADLFLFPSTYDNAPLVVREAAALSTPAILAAGSTAAEVIKPDSNGFLVDPDAGSMAAELLRLNVQRDLISKAGNGARHSIVRSWEDVVEEVADRYAVIIKNHKK